MLPLPPLECLRFFEAAARRESFARAGEELGVTGAAVSHRVRALEEHIGHPLFDRSRSSVVLNERGKACLADIQRVLSEIGDVVERHGNGPIPRRLRIVAVESIADRWLMPKLTRFTASQPDIAIELETDHRRIEPNQHGFDFWITFAGETMAPEPHSTRHEMLFEEAMFPVCSPALLETRRAPQRAVDLHSWPFLYHLGWPSDWSYWFASHDAARPDLSQASGFRLSSSLVHAAVQGKGVFIGRRTIIAPELRNGTLVPLLDQCNEASSSCWLISAPAAMLRPEARAFREWILRLAAEERGSARAATATAQRGAPEVNSG